MIYVIDALNYAKAPQLLDEMHRLRAKVFKDRLDWEVTVRNGRERDYFDDLNPVYLLHADEGGRVLATLRLLPTTGPHMLSDTFPQLMDDEEPIRSANIWESSRFCVDTNLLVSGDGPRGIGRVTGELLCGAYTFGMQVGLTHFTSAFDVIMHRVLRRAGAKPDLVGEKKLVGKVHALAGLFDISPEVIADIRERCAVTGPVLATPSGLLEAEAAAVARVAATPANDQDLELA